MACIHCGNPPTPPNYLNTYETDNGEEEYDICQMCEDFERESGEAAEEYRAYLSSCEGYGAWQSRWQVVEMLGK